MLQVSTGRMLFRDGRAADDHDRSASSLLMNDPQSAPGRPDQRGGPARRRRADSRHGAGGLSPVLGRDPAPEELGDALFFLGQQELTFKDQGDHKKQQHEALVDFCQALLSLNEFAYVE